MCPQSLPKLSHRLAAIVALGVLLVSANARAETGTVIVKSQPITTRLSAYARVVPIALARLRAAQPGVIEGLDVIPGQALVAGESVGFLRGPEIAALLAQRRAAVAGAQAALRAAQHLLATERQDRAAKLSTRQAVFDAESAVSRGQAQLAAARAALKQAKDNAILRAPDNGTVASLAVADGERVGAGQTLLSLQPAHNLWIKAVYYGADARAVRRGMRGRFIAADGTAPLTVEVTSILPAMRADGGLAIGLRPQAAAAHLVSGQAGTVVLDGARRSVVLVPSRALILDRGRWWVIVHTPQGNEDRAVLPGPRRGDETEILKGLEAGSRVVVVNAYLKFHRDVSQRYQPPD